VGLLLKALDPRDQKARMRELTVKGKLVLQGDPGYLFHHTLIENVKRAHPFYRRGLIIHFDVRKARSFRSAVAFTN
jgi:predicted metalloprotease